MPWIKIDDQIAHHPKFVAAGPIASWMWVCGNGYCNKYLTDGEIPEHALGSLGSISNPKKWADVLVHVGLWERMDAGYRVHDFHDHNPYAADVREQRRVKAEAGRLGGLKSGEARKQKGNQT